MSRIKSKKSTLAGLIDSDDEDQLLGGMPTPDSSILENMAPARKGRGRPKAATATATATSASAPSKVTKVKPAPRRLSGRANGKAKAPAPEKKGKRTALTDKTNLQSGSDTEEVEEFGQDEVMEDAELEESIEVIKKPKSKAAPTKRGTAKGKPTKPVVAKKVRNAETPILPPQPAPKTTKRGRRAKEDALVEPIAEEIIPETQVEEVEDEMEVDGDVDEEVEETIVRPTRNAILPPPKPRRQHSIQRRHAGSGSDTERSDPTLRRKLGELTKKFEALNAKHQDLREVGLKEGERNFEKMRKQNEENMKKSSEVISSLKADLAYQTSLAKDSKALRKKTETQKNEITAFQTQVAQLKASLAESQAEHKTLIAETSSHAFRKQSLVAQFEAATTENKRLTIENKTLTSKLAANRTAAASVESLHSKVPGSAAKPNGGIRMVGTAEAAQLAQAAQLKEDIYSDLTGLVIQGVKRDTNDDVFNCLQTSRNGTLHFKLATANEKSAESYDERQCTYVPQLDPSRDQELIELLPDYLVDEITFPRNQAAKFYARVVKALTEKPA